MQKLLFAVALALPFAALGCNEDAAATVKPGSAGAAMAAQDEPVRPNIARPDVARPDVARPDTVHPETARPEIARPSAADVPPARDPVNGLPIYPGDAGVPKEPPEASPLNR